MPERLVFLSPVDPPEAWAAMFREAAPEVEFLVSQGEAPVQGPVDWAVVWRPPAGFLAGLQGLRCVFSLGAGVDHVLADGTYPSHVPLARAVDPTLTAGMSEYVVLHVLAHYRGLFRSLRAQRDGRWKPFYVKPTAEMRVGLMGLGELGLDAARKLKPFGFRLASWSASRKIEPGVTSYAGASELAEFLSQCDILVCLLPLTATTRGILNSATFDLLPEGASVINAARGGHVIEADLIEALGNGGLAGATLDVFQTEPLPADSPLWRHPKVVITPHIASQADPRVTALAMVESIARVRAGQPPLNAVDPAKGY